MQFFGDKYGDTVRVVQIGGTAGQPGRLLDGTVRGHARPRDGAARRVQDRQRGRDRRGRAADRGGRGAGGAQLFLNERAIDQARNARAGGEGRRDEQGAGEGKASAIAREAEAFVANALPDVDQQRSAAADREVQAGRRRRGNVARDPDNAQRAAVPRRGGAGRFDAEQVHLAVSVSPELTSRFNAGKILQQIAPMVGGKGGGKADLARGAGNLPGSVDQALERARELLV